LFNNISVTLCLHYINKFKWDVAIVGQALTENRQVAKVMVDVAQVDVTE